MMNFKDTLIELLKSDERFLIEWELSLNHVKDSIDSLDEGLLDLLYNNEQTREKFFEKNKNSDYIKFKSKDFKFYLDENKLDNSYTQFENQIGLFFDNKLLKNRWEVVLNFPFKDCILEWGQSRDDWEDVYFEYSEKTNDFEEKTGKRKEVFFNEVLWKDEIDRLKEDKVLVNWKRFTKNWEEKVWKIKRDENGLIRENLIIKWNNLLALHSLKKEFFWEIKLIYIDPPYNTWWDSFKYNDNFNHSTWLTFMKNRLEVAKDLLRDDWVIFIQCDDNEQAYLKVLMDEVFWFEKMINVISVKMNESKWLKNAHIEKKMPKNKEYLLVYWKNKDRFLFNPEKIEKDKDELLGYVKYYNKYIPNIDKDINDWVIENFDKWNDIDTKLKYQDKLIYMVAPDNEVKNNGVKENHFFSITNSRWKNNVFYNNKWNILKVLFLWENTSKFLWDLWVDISTININKESWVQTLSNGQKPEKLIERIIKLSTQPWDIVLDYHLWSGTTCSVAHKMWRQYIGIEQMDYIETISVERLKKVIEWEQWGISKNINWNWWWDFIYVELKKSNEEAKEKIMNFNNLEELEVFFDEMYNKYFLNYNVKIKEFKEKILKDEKFRSLDLEKQKKMFVSMLDLNQMYVNMSERKDKKFGISDEDVKLSEEFYWLR